MPKVFFWQGDRTKNVGVVDSDYIVHYGLPTLGANDPDKVRKIIFVPYKYQTEFFHQLCKCFYSDVCLCIYLLD